MNSEELFKKTLEGVKKASEKAYLDGDVLGITLDPLDKIMGDKMNESKSESEENELLTMEKFKEVEYLSENEF